MRELRSLIIRFERQIIKYYIGMREEGYLETNLDITEIQNRSRIVPHLEFSERKAKVWVQIRIVKV
jgi:hypothetical protein